MDLQPVKAYVTTNDYFRISNDFIDTNYFYKIIARNGNTEVGEEGPRGLQLGNYGVNVVCSETCADRNVSTNKAFAWTLEVIESAAFGDYISFGPGKRDLGNNTSERYFFFVNDAAWNGDYEWDQGIIEINGGGKVIGNVGATNLCYRMPNGNRITTGGVYAIPFEAPVPTSYTKEIISAQYQCDFPPGSVRRANLQNLVNTGSSTEAPISPSLNCNPYPYCGPTHGTGGDEFTYGWNPVTYSGKSPQISGFWRSADWYNTGPGDPAGLWDPIENNDYPISNVNVILHALGGVLEGLERPTQDTLTPELYLSDLVTLTISPLCVEEEQEVEMFFAHDVFDDNLDIDSVDFDLSSGLYSFCLNFVDGDRLNIYFIFGDNDDGEGIIQLADYLNVKLYPVPVINNQFQIDLNSTNGALLDVQYKLFDLNGVLLDQDLELEIGGDKITVTSDFPISYGNEYLVAKFIFSDDSQKDVLIYAH